LRFRDYYLKRESTVPDSDTVIIDLNITDPISYISIEYEATNGATSCVDHELHDDVSKIEIVDGSDVICSLSMKQWQALNFYEMKKLPHQLLDEQGGNTQEEKCYIHFGRYPDDPEFYFDPKKFKNPQLRITHSLTISGTAGFATGTGKITVMARVIEEGARAYKGFLVAKEKYSWTGATSGDELIDLPVDMPYRMLLVQALLTTYTPQECITKLKMECDGGKYIPFEDYVEDIVDRCERDFGFVQQRKTLLGADGNTALLDVYDIRKAVVQALVADHIANVEAIDAEKITHSLIDFSSVTTPAFRTTAKAVEAIVEGIAPHAILAVPFGDLNDETSWFPATNYSDIKLYATQAQASANAIILQQHRM